MCVCFFIFKKGEKKALMKRCETVSPESYIYLCVSNFKGVISSSQNILLQDLIKKYKQVLLLLGSKIDVWKLFLLFPLSFSFFFANNYWLLEAASLLRRVYAFYYCFLKI